MLRLISIILACGYLFTPLASLANGALVFGHKSSGEYDYFTAVNAPTEREAIDRATHECSYVNNFEGCQIETTFRNACLTYYRGNHSFAYSLNDHGVDAHDQCKFYNNFTVCPIHATVCDGTPPAQTGSFTLLIRQNLDDPTGIALLFAAGVALFLIVKSRTPAIAPAVRAAKSRTPKRQPKLPPVPRQPPAAPRPPPVPSAQELATIDPSEGMILKIKKTTKNDSWGRVLYMIDARLDASSAIRATIAKHRLGGRLIYESDKRQQYLKMAQIRAEQSRPDTPIFAPAEAQLKATGKTFLRLGQALYHRARAALALKITVDKLLAGVHVECRDVDELGEAETAIVAAKHNLENYLAEFTAFDGQETIY